MTTAPRLLGAILSASLLISPLHSLANRTDTAERRTIRAAVAFMGGETALRAIRTRQTVAVEVLTNVGQEEFPGEVVPSGGITTTYTWDKPRHLLRRQQLGVNVDPRLAASTLVQDERTAAFFRDTVRRVGGNGFIRTAESIRRQFRLAPEVLLLAALDAPDASLWSRGRSVVNGHDAIGVEIRVAPDTVVMWMAVADGRPLAVDHTLSDPLFPGRIDRDSFLAWARYGSVFLPTATEAFFNGWRIRTSAVASVEINGARADALPEVPPGFVVNALPVPPAKLVEIVPDVVRIEGGDGNVAWGGGIPYYSFAVRQGDSVVVIETPLDPTRTNEVLDSVRAHFPSARATTVLVTHAHYDHIGGIPTATERGLRLIAARELVPFLRGVGTATKKRTITAVDDSLTVGTGDSRFIIYRVPTVHARGMLLAYFPAHRLIIESDFVGAASNTQQHEFADWVRARGLNVERIAGTHGTGVSFADFLAKLK